MTAASLGALPVGLDPGRDEAREWAERELADPAYDAAQPTPIDRIARAIGDFLTDLLTPRGDLEWSPVLAIAAIVIAAGLVVAALLIWGRPRPAHREAQRSALLFGEAETRSAAELRSAAASHAAAAEWDSAIVVRFRALARGLEERGLIEAPPGTTAQGLARRAVPAFPAEDGPLRQAARGFDDVRYLRRSGTAELYAAITALDDRLSRVKASPAAGVGPGQHSATTAVGA